MVGEHRYLPECELRLRKPLRKGFRMFEPEFETGLLESTGQVGQAFIGETEAHAPGDEVPDFAQKGPVMRTYHWPATSEPSPAMLELFKA